ncbi:MAG: hypothetical protein Q8M16_11120 [Pirellulaceae bacterium]|nr:hypothetical protein [Pirellulaceae bacterium]
MAELSLSNSAGRDAVIHISSVQEPLRVRWLDATQRPATSMRLVKSTLQHDTPALLKQFATLTDLGAQLIANDPEIDFDSVGSYLQNSSRVLVNQQGQLVHKSQTFEIIRAPDGSVRDRRPKAVTLPNVSADSPLRWSGKLIKKADAIRKFVFSSKVQLTHINGLTYDFLFGIARELEQQDSLLILGAGPKANQPLILRRGSTPYRGFLEGRTSGEQYALVLHLSNLELKTPDVETPSVATTET